MDPNQYLFDAVSTMTGGLINDTRTLYLGAVVLGFILIGLDHLKDGFEHMIEMHSYKRAVTNAEEARMDRDQYARGSFEYDEANYLYRHYVSRAAKSRLRM